MDKQINLMMEMVEENLTESIGKVKELLESCCKEICNYYGETDLQKIKLPRLVKLATQHLKISNVIVGMDKKEAVIITRITSSLNGLASGIAELRNQYGSGHGRLTNFKSLQQRHAELAVGSSITLVRCLSDTHNYRINSNSEK